jgi:hypothetical protein
MIRSSKFVLAFFSALLSLTAATTVSAQQPGITDTEIKFGNIMPYSGPASALSVTGKAFAAYFDLVNEKGGVNGRKLNMISLDDGFSPPKTVEATRRLVENDGVAPSCSEPWAPAEFGDRKVSQRRQGAASVPDQLRIEMERPDQSALADGTALGAQLCRGSRHRGALRPRQESQCALCDPLSERRCRKGLSARRLAAAPYRASGLVL